MHGLVLFSDHNNDALSHMSKALQENNYQPFNIITYFRGIFLTLNIRDGTNNKRACL